MNVLECMTIQAGKLSEKIKAFLKTDLGISLLWLVLSAAVIVLQIIISNMVY